MFHMSKTKTTGYRQQNRSIWSLTWYWTTNQNWHTLIVHALNIYKPSLSWDESTPAARSHVPASGHTKVLQMRRWRYSRRSWTSTWAQPSEKLVNLIPSLCFERMAPWKWTILKGNQFLNHLSQPSVFSKLCLLSGEENCLLFGVADGAPIRVHEAYALNLCHFLD